MDIFSRKGASTPLVVGVVVVVAAAVGVLLWLGSRGGFGGNAITVSLAAQNSSGESGTAEITEKGEKVSVVVNLAGAPTGVSQPAHIHAGSCVNLGGPLYPLTLVADGKSETELTISMAELLAKLPLAVNVHKSETEGSVYVSCGDIVPPAGTGSNSTGAVTGNENEGVGADEGKGTAQGKTYTVEMGAAGFTPSVLTIAVGDTVEFINKDTIPHWPASGRHPAHDICAGFDSKPGVESGATYSYTFTEAKECPMHDHLNPKLTGKITVRAADAVTGQ